MKVAPLVLFLSLFAVTSSFSDPVEGLVLPLKEVSISSPVEEIIREIKVEEGDVVARGQPLALLMDDVEKLEVDRTAQIIEKASFGHKANQELLKDDYTSRGEALSTEVDFALAKILHQAAEVRLRQRTILAPLDGIVVKKYKEAGEAVAVTEKMFDVVNIDQVYVQCYLDPALMNRIEPGQKANVRFPHLPDPQTFEGRVAFVDPRIDAGSGLFRVKLIIDNPDHRIKAGSRGEVEFDSKLHAGTGR